MQNAATSLTFTGAATGAQAGLTKTGSGARTLTGANNYTGLTTVNAGVLQLNAAAQTPVIGSDARRRERHRRQVGLGLHHRLRSGNHDPVASSHGF